MQIPTVEQSVSVPTRALTDQELQYWAMKIAQRARDAYEEDHGVWPSFEAFIAFTIGVESVRFVYHGDMGSRQEFDRFAKAVMAAAHNTL